MAYMRNPGKSSSQTFKEAEEYGKARLKQFAAQLSPMPLPDGWMVSFFNFTSLEDHATSTLTPNDYKHDGTEKLTTRVTMAQFVAPGDKHVHVDAVVEVTFDFFSPFSYGSRYSVKEKFVVYTQIGRKDDGFFYQDYADREMVILALLTMEKQNV